MKPGDGGLADAAPRVALIGCGRWGANLARVFHDLGALAGVADADPAAAQAQSRALGVRALPIEAVLADNGIEAVAIAAPAIHHAELTLKALAAGKDVFVEKPFAMTMADAETMASAASHAGRVLMVGHLMQYHPAFEALLAIVRGGEIGELRYACSNRASLGRLRTEEDALHSLAPHDISMLLAVFGEAPDQVRASGGAYVTPGVADAVWTDLRFPGGCRAMVFNTWLAPVKEQRLTVVGAHGMLTFDDLKPWPEKLQLRRYAVEPGQAGPTLTSEAAVPIAVTPDEPLRRECSHFLAACRTRQPPRTDAREAVAVQAVLVAAALSLADGLAPPAGV